MQVFRRLGHALTTSATNSGAGATDVLDDGYSTSSRINSTGTVGPDSLISAF
jgi:hypothetical protein